jgi:hypothetical protein
MKRLIPLTSIAGFLLAVAIVRPALAQEIADKIFLGGPILTMDDTAPRAEAIAVKDGRVLAVGILAIGSLDELKAAAGKQP